MEGKKQVGSAPSSFPSELFGTKDASKTDVFSSIFPPQKVAGSWQKQQKQGILKHFGNSLKVQIIFGNFKCGTVMTGAYSVSQTAWTRTVPVPIVAQSTKTRAQRVRNKERILAILARLFIMAGKRCILSRRPHRTLVLMQPRRVKIMIRVETIPMVHLGETGGKILQRTESLSCRIAVLLGPHQLKNFYNMCDMKKMGVCIASEFVPAFRRAENSGLSVKHSSSFFLLIVCKGSGC
ncbi:hypothetical protein AKJ16_DCAP09760 [Drosera capensis]